MRTYYFALGLVSVLTLIFSACEASLDGPNRAPVARAGQDKTHELSSAEAVVFDGSGSFDPDGDGLVYVWRVVAKPLGETVDLQDITSATARLEPTVAGTWIIVLTVSDDQVESLPDVVRLLVAGQGCTGNAECDDGAYCNGAETCQDGLCVDWPPPDCDDGDDCTIDTCDEGTDSCSNDPPGAEGPPGDASCEDGIDNDCDGLTDIEDGACGICQQDFECDDLDACTVDTCSNGSCAHSNATPGTPCDDGVFCNGALDECDNAGGCGPSAQSASPCNVLCFSICFEANSECRPNPLGTSCSDPGDGLACTLDACDGVGVCESSPDHGACPQDEYCLPDCSIDDTGCVPEPTNFDLSCQAGDPPDCTVLTEGLDNQAACIECSSKIAPTTLAATDFSTADGSACDLDGWTFIPGSECSFSISNCEPQQTGDAWVSCCDETATICIDLAGNWVLRTDYKRNCGDSVRHEWRLFRSFDTTGLTDLELCFDLSENNATNDEWMLVYLADEVHRWPGERIWCGQDGPGIDDNDTWYHICIPLTKAGGWESDNPDLQLTFVGYSSNDDDRLFLDNIELHGYPIASPRTLVDVFSDDFAGCVSELQDGYNGWSVTGVVECPGFAECAASIPNYNGTVIEVDDHDAVLERTVDAGLLDDDVKVCFWSGEDSSDNNEGITVSFEPWAGAGWVTVYDNQIDMGPLGCRQHCINLSLIDPAVNSSPTLGLRINLDSDSNARSVALAMVKIRGSLLESGGSVFTFGGFDTSTDEQVSFDVDPQTTDDMTARVECRWTPAGDQVTASTEVLVPGN